MGAPYLSIVVTTRNDDHGESLLRRTQTFINALAAQLKNYDIPSELVMVEWNPPADRPPLRDVLQFPAELGPLKVRFIQVPPSVHARYRHSEALPLYQMIGKNVGVRRARGQFVLATNIDILFSNELFEFLAARELKPGYMYRIDRHDVITDVPVDASVDDRLAYCESHVVRLNTREGTYYTTPDGSRGLGPKDIAAPDAGICLGEGWFPAEYDGVQWFRWVENDARVTVTGPRKPPPLLFEVEPGPSVKGNSFDLLFVDEKGSLLTETRVCGRSLVTLQLPSGEGPKSFHLRTPQGGYPVRHNPRVLNFRVFRCEWQLPPCESIVMEPVAVDHITSSAPPEESTQAESHAAEPVPESFAENDFTPSSSGVDAASAPISIAPPDGHSEFKSTSQPVGIARDTPTLLGKLLGVLHRAAEGAPVITVWVPVPNLVRRLLQFCLRVDRAPAAIPEESVSSTTAIPEKSVPVADVPPVAEREQSQEPKNEPEPESAVAVEPPFTEANAARDVQPVPAEATPLAGTPRFLSLLNDPQSDYYYQPEYLHTNGCGDFTLMAREHWFELRAYPELDMYSFHIDSVFCFAAHHSGVCEVLLQDPMRIYHIEHGRGSGWSPEGENLLFDRLRAKGVSWLEYNDVITWASQMRRFQSPMIFNRSNWGLSEVELPEVTLESKSEDTEW